MMTDDPSMETDSFSDEMKEVRAKAASLLAKAESSSFPDMAVAVEKAASALKTAAEVEKAQTETSKLRQEISKLELENRTSLRRERSERMRDYVALLTPMVTVVTLAATLIAQNWQFLRSEKDKREEAMDAQWQDAVKTISASGALSPAVIALQPFLRSSKYSDQARDVAVNLLLNSTDSSFFDGLFGTALAPVTGNNVDRVLRLDRALVARGNPLWTKSWDGEKQINDMGRLNKDEAAAYAYIEAVTPAITSEIGSVLKTSRKPGSKIDLSATYFKTGNWSGVVFNGVNLENANLYQMDLKNAQLDQVTQFAGLNLNSSAWWEAKSMSRPLFDYLESGFKLKPKIGYGPRYAVISQDEYDRAVEKLRARIK